MAEPLSRAGEQQPSASGLGLCGVVSVVLGVGAPTGWVGVVVWGTLLVHVSRGGGRADGWHGEQGRVWEALGSGVVVVWWGGWWVLQGLQAEGSHQERVSYS